MLSQILIVNYNNIRFTVWNLGNQIQNPKGSGQHRAPKILIVDDEPDIATSFKLGLESYGFQADSYDNPLTALFNYKPGIYDLLLLDIRMSLMNGFELYKEIRNLDKSVKVFFITAFDLNHEEFKKAFPEMTLKHFIKKPVHIEDLARELKQKMEENYEVIG